MSATQRYHALRRVLAASCVATLPLLASCGKNQTAAAPKPPSVGAITVRYQLVKGTTDLPGRTAAVMTSDIRPQVSGVILSRLFTEGSDVKAGQQLYQIDPAPYQATLDSAIASLKHDQAQLTVDRLQAARFKPLAAAQAVSEQDYDNAVASVQEDEANIASAQATIESARINLQYTKMYSPISGTIGASSVTPGALVTADQTTVLATVTQLDPLYVDVNEPTVTWLRLKEEIESGQLQTNPDGTAKVTLTMEDGNTYKQPGELQFAQVNVDQNTGTVLVRAFFPNPDHLLLPGMYVHAQVDEGDNKNGVLVPQQAVSHNQHGDATVMLINNQNIVSQQVIDTSENLGTYWVVTSGLKPGDRVVVDGLLNAVAGKAVTPTDETAKYTYNAS